MSERELLGCALELAAAYREGLGQRPVGARAELDALRARLGVELTDAGESPEAVLAGLAAAADGGLSANGPRWFGFVDGGAQPIALAADWLAAAWDQNAGLAVVAPAAMVVEEVAGGWVRDLLGLPAAASAGFVTGGQMGNFTGLAAARGALLGRAGWDVSRDGLWGAPPLHVVVGEHAHVTIFGALRMLGMGAGKVLTVPADEAGRMRADELRRTLAGCDGPTLVCALAGNVNTGAFDPFEEIADAIDEHGDCWLHVDGACGLWAAATPARRHLTAGIERAHSWVVDAHKWLNVPYDCGIALVRDPDAHRAAMTLRAAYLVREPGAEHRDRSDYAPEASRRARGFAVYATLRALGRQGVAELVERSCAQAASFAELLGADPGVELLNEVELNQVLVRFRAADPDARTLAVLKRVQREGVCWVGPTSWGGRPAMRISIVNYATTTDDVERSAASILAAARAEGG